MKSVVIITIAAVLLILAARNAHAQSVEAASVAVQYDAAFYGQFSPRTALDMVNQTPGFVLDTTEDGARRGFEGSVGNVLIDGERPTAKGEGVIELLRGIAATRVVRIEIRRAADTAGDASGNRILANVVLQPAPWQGAWSGGVELANRYRPAPNGWAALAGAIGSTDVVVNASSYSLLRNLPGSRRLSDEAGATVTSRHVASPRHYHEYAAGGQVIRRVAGGRLEVTAKTSVAWYDDATALVTDEEPAHAATERVPYAQHERAIEAGVSYRRAMRGWDWTVLSLVTDGHFGSHVTSTRGAGPPAHPLVRQTSRRDTLELVGRVAAVRARSRGSSQIGFESVRNTLDGLSALTIDIGEGEMDLPVSNARVDVTEDRGELFASESWRLNDRWSIDGRIGVELSRLRFRGDVAHAVTLVYAKPSASFTRTLSNQTQIHGRLLRTVGQLDFADFVATASLADEQLAGANPTLRPQASWRVEGGADIRLRPDTGVSVTLFHDWFDAVVDWTAWGEGDGRVDARGNLGSGRTAGARVSSRSPVPRVTGLSVTAAATVQATRTLDPLTLRARRISGIEPARLDVGLRQNLPKAVALGASYSYRAGTSAYRLREIDWQRRSPSLDAFLEWPLPRTLRLRIQATSILGSPERRQRTFFEPDRSHGVSGTEQIERRPGHWWLMTVSGAF